MQYRKFGDFDWRVSALGFGCMRLPTRDGSIFSADVEEEETIRMIRHAIDLGVNYVDSAYPYHIGRSEVLLGKALKDGYREKVKLVTKSPVWMLKEAGDFDTYLDEQLTRLDDDHIDFYLLHGLGARRWKKVLDIGVMSRAEAAVKDGRVGHLGFSFHDDFNAFKEIVDGYGGWKVCLVQYNYMDVENQAGTAGVRYAASRGLAVAVMEPLLGGCLAKVPPVIKEMFEAFPVKRSPADWALQWVWSQPEVSVVLSGMSSMEQVEENLASADVSRVGSMGKDELELLERVRETFKERAAIPCTGCGYCMPCPANVNIPRNITLYNDGVMYDDWSAPRFSYLQMSGDASRAEGCTECGECEEKCPQDIAIREWMPRIHEKLGGQG